MSRFWALLRRSLPPLVLVGAVIGLVVSRTAPGFIERATPKLESAAELQPAPAWIIEENAHHAGEIVMSVREDTLGIDGHSQPDPAPREVIDRHPAAAEGMPRAPVPSAPLSSEETLHEPLEPAIEPHVHQVSKLAIFGELLRDREAMAGMVSIMVLLSALYITLSNHYAGDATKWAFGSIGTIMGYWLGG